MLQTSDLNAIRTGPRDVTPPVLLLHSAGLDLTFWQPQIDSLRQNHDVVALDLPGHGRSKGTAADIALDQICATVAAAIGELGAGPVELVGLSVGGLIAQSIALDHPQLVHSLTLIDTAACFPPAGQAAMRERAATVRRDGIAPILPDLFGHWFIPDTLIQRPHLVDGATKTLLHDDPYVHAALWEMIAAFDLVDRLPRITAPTLVLVGEHDSSSPVAAARRMRDAIPRARMHIVPETAHLAPLESPGPVNDHIQAFLTEVNR